MADGKPKIVVLGGGLGALSAVYWLTEAVPDWRERYDGITVHQMGWRLGGKCASGRNLAPDRGARIEEHGLHVWFGFYENAFLTMRRVLEQLRTSSSTVATFRSWTEAFAPRSVWTFEQKLSGLYAHWPVLFPTNDGVPGDGAADFVRAVRQNVLGWIRHGERVIIQREDARPVRRAVQRLLQAGALAATATGTALARLAEDAAALVAQTPHHPSRRRFLPHLLRTLVDEVWQDLSAEADDEEAERMRVAADLLGTCLVGVLQDRLWEPLWVPRSPWARAVVRRIVAGSRAGAYPPRFESVDEEELRDWLRRHGAHPETVEQGADASNLLDQIYDVAFAYADGDRTRPALAAGSGVRGMLRVFFGYKGAFLWEMNAGMGDTVLAPLYALLAHRGVRFRFFQRVRAVEATADGTRVGLLRIGKQVRLLGDDYGSPFVRPRGLDCWPAEPLWERIHPEDAARLRAAMAASGNPYLLESTTGEWPDVAEERIEIGPDDHVILGLPVGVLADTCRQLLAVSEPWRHLVANVPAIPTYAVQLWLREDTQRLGWAPATRKVRDWLARQDADERTRRGRPLGLSAVLCGYDDHLVTWADMSHLLPQERWPADGPKSIAYFCGAFADGMTDPHRPLPPGHYAAQLGRVRREAQTVLEERIGRLWTRHPAGLDPAALYAPGGRGARYDEQYWRVNVDPAERYTLSPAGSTKHRLPSRPSPSQLLNLVLAGDWTLNGVLNMGSVEAAVVSGMEAAKAIAGRLPVDVVAWRQPHVRSERWPPGRLDRAREVGDWEADALVAQQLGTHPGRSVWERLATAPQARPPSFPATPACAAGAAAAALAADDIARVQALFREHGAEIFLVLACYALPSAYAAARGARVLGRTRYLLERPIRRLCETARFVQDVLTAPTTTGLEQARQVRTIHATLRHLIRTDRSEPWNTATLGVPLNQEDLLGTLMTFSWVVLDGLRRLGVERASERANAEAYVRVWRVVGVALGIQPELLPVDVAEAEELTRTIWTRQIVAHAPNPVGRQLTQTLFEHMERHVPLPGLEPFVSSLARFLLPPDVADALGVARRIGLDEATSLALRFPATRRLFSGMLRDWGLAVVEQVIRDCDPDGQLVHVPHALRDGWWAAVPERRRRRRTRQLARRRPPP